MFVALAGDYRGWDGALCILMALPLVSRAGHGRDARFHRPRQPPDLPPSIAVMLILPVWAVTESSGVAHTSSTRSDLR